MLVCVDLCFVFNGKATTCIYTYCHTLYLHDALPIFGVRCHEVPRAVSRCSPCRLLRVLAGRRYWSSVTGDCDDGCGRGGLVGRESGAGEVESEILDVQAAVPG